MQDKYFAISNVLKIKCIVKDEIWRTSNDYSFTVWFKSVPITTSIVCSNPAHVEV